MSPVRTTLASMLSVALLASVCTTSAFAASPPPSAPAGVPTVVPPITASDQPGVGIPAPSPAATVFIAPSAAGASCTKKAPCGSLAAALKLIGNGSATIQAAGGTYANEDISGNYPSTIGAVVLRPAPNAVAAFGQLRIGRPNLTFDHMTFTANVYVYSTGLQTTFYRVHVSGGGILLRASHARVAGSLIEGGAAHDGVNVAGHTVRTTDTLIDSNVIRNIGGGTQYQEHPDCIQMFDTDAVTIRRNTLTNCYNSGITFSAGSRLGISNVVVVANFITGCIAELQRCGNGSSMDLRTAVSNVTIRNNSFTRGSLRMPLQPGVSATRNIVSYLSVYNPCTTSLSTSMVGGYPTALCKAGLPGMSDGNWLANATFVDVVHGDLHVAPGSPDKLPASDEGSAPASGLPAADNVDFDGTPFASTTVGADQPS